LGQTVIKLDAYGFNKQELRGGEKWGGKELRGLSSSGITIHQMPQGL
jgi:hypothetical protein